MVNDVQGFLVFATYFPMRWIKIDVTNIRKFELP